jgi:putative oxidoreductase
MDTGLLLLRVAVGALFIGHGTQKLFGWFGGYGIEGTGGFMESLGYRPGKHFAFLGGVAEAGGGLLLLLGFLTPLAAAAIIAMMINAILAVHLENGAWAQNNGFEYPLVLAVVAAAVAVAGAGAYSIDAELGWDLSGIWGAAGAAAGVVAGLVTATIRRIDTETAPAAAAQDTSPRAA